MIFIDTAGWIALVNKRDELHREAADAYKRVRKRRRVTSEAVLLETCNSFCAVSVRHIACTFIQTIYRSEELGLLEIVQISDGLFRRGVRFFEHHKDKEWSLTDCISFVIMKERRIKEAFTVDHHFEQAGFIVLL